MPLVAGVDPGSRVMGFCVLDTEKPLAERVLTIRAIAVVGRTVEDRLESAGLKLAAAIEEYDRDLAAIAIEDGYVGKNAFSALMVGEFRGVAFFVAKTTSDAQVYRVSAAKARPLLCVPGGRMERKQVKQEVVVRVATFFSLKYAPPEDAADAGVLAWWASQQLRPTPIAARPASSTKVPF